MKQHEYLSPGQSPGSQHCVVAERFREKSDHPLHLRMTPFTNKHWFHKNIAPILNPMIFFKCYSSEAGNDTLGAVDACLRYIQVAIEEDLNTPREAGPHP